jgi:CheY-like chemotaxis protein
MKTILYLEDDEHDIFFLKRALATEQAGLTIQNVHNLGDATAYLEGTGEFSDRHRFPLPDLVVSDLTVPGGSGFQLTRWLREESQFKSLPVILLSGSAQEPQLQKAAVSGANFCLQKSADFSELLSKIRDLLRL